MNKNAFQYDAYCPLQWPPRGGGLLWGGFLWGWVSVLGGVSVLDRLSALGGGVYSWGCLSRGGLL